MSLTSIIKEKGIYYHALRNAVNLEYCINLIEHQNKYIQKPIIKPVKGVDYALSGMSVIYALRDYLFGENLWKETVAGRKFEYPKYKFPERWLIMAFYDSAVRFGDKINPKTAIYLTGNYKETLEDIYEIAMTFKEIIGSPSKFLNNQSIHLNPTFNGSHAVGGADANMIIGNTLWEIKTTAKNKPLTLDNILQQIGYVILDYNNQYNIQNITWYYARQKTLFTHPVEKFLSVDKKLIAQKILR